MVRVGVDCRAMPPRAPGSLETCHDMRQPVSSMSALAAAALAEPDLHQPTRARLEQIMEQAEWLADLIRHSLRTGEESASGAGQTDLIRVVDDAVTAERVTWPGEVTVVGLASPVLTAVYPVQLRRMVANLLANATRAAGPSGAVTIEIGRTQGLAMVAIEDTGPGFGKIEPGLGIGLAAVARYVATHGGMLERGGSASGGARVTLRLPVAVAADSGTPARRDAATMVGAPAGPGSPRTARPVSIRPPLSAHVPPPASPR
jgi:signal transduction histidine kinase